MTDCYGGYIGGLLNRLASEVLEEIEQTSVWEKESKVCVGMDICKNSKMKQKNPTNLKTG